MPTDEAKTHLDRILRDWSLMDGDERLAQARFEALGPLEKWLQGGAQSAAVVIRTAQTLLADPENPGVDQRPAVEEVRQVVQRAWASAGVQEKGMLGLQSLILAGWPQERSGLFALAPLLDSAWLATRRPKRYRKWIDQWRQDIAQPPLKASAKPLQETPTEIEKTLINLGAPTRSGEIQQLKVMITNQWGAGHGNNFATALEAVINDIQILGTHLASTNETTLRWKSIVQSVQEIQQSLIQKSSSLNQEHELLWWGQARYSPILNKPYRRIEDSAERLWWMAVEASALATDVDAAPAASFLMETLLQVDRDIDTKRPLKDWLTEFFKTLRRLHASKQYADSDAMKLTDTLKQLVEKDALGLPVSWVHLQAIDSTLQESDIAERAKESVGLDVDTPIDRGEWAAWVFRESLLDWRLAGVK